MSFCYAGPPPPSLNEIWNFFEQRVKRVWLSPKARKFRNHVKIAYLASDQCRRAVKTGPMKGKLRFGYRSCKRTRHRYDISNLAKAAEDALVACEIIGDDSLILNL